MIRIQIVKNNNDLEKIIFRGHADYGEYGKDIVCAAASATFLCTVNGILSLKDDTIEVISTKDVQIIKIIAIDEITSKLLYNMLRCLESLEKQYPKNIKIN